MNTQIRKPFLLLAFLLSITSIAEAKPSTKLRGVMVARAIQPTDIDVLETWGANVVRYPLDWLSGASTATDEEYQAWLEQALGVLDNLLPNFEVAGTKVIINLYSPPGGFNRNKKCISSHKIFCDKWAQDSFITTWQKIATRYAGNSAIYGFDLANEPGFRKSAKGLKTWSQLADATTGAIRAIDPTRHVIIEPPFGDFFRFSDLKPLPYTNLSYSPHVYYPLEFQHQGLGGLKLGVKYPSKSITKKSLISKMKRISQFAKKNKGARIYIGEFSAVRWAPGTSSYNYLKDLISIFESEGWDWTYHAFRESDAWSLEHDGNIKNKKPATKTTDRLKLMKGFWSKNQPL